MAVSVISTPYERFEIQSFRIIISLLMIEVVNLAINTIYFTLSHSFYNVRQPYNLYKQNIHEVEEI